MYDLLLRKQEAIYGLEDLDTLDIVHILGTVYERQRRFIEAEQMFVHVLEGYEKAVGEEHVSQYATALTMMIHLGEVYMRQGEYAKARALWGTAHPGRQHMYGPSHPRCTRLEARIQKLDDKISRIQDEKPSSVLSEIDLPSTNKQDIRSTPRTSRRIIHVSHPATELPTTNLSNTRTQRAATSTSLRQRFKTMFGP